MPTNDPPSPSAKASAFAARSAFRWGVAGYFLAIAATCGIFLLISAYGEHFLKGSTESALTALPDRPAAVPAASGGDLLHVLLALAAMIVCGQVLARLFVYLRQPPVIGEVVAGILLGPSLLGAERSAQILDPAAGPTLAIIAQLGVILYMFVVGLEMNVELLRRHARATLATSHASILVPFVLGSFLALFLYPRLSIADVKFTSFALFLSVAMSITAFPVLARIVTDCGLMRTELGAMALGCAAIDDVTAWCLLAFVVGVVKAQVGQGLLVLVGATVYIGVMLFVIRPALRTLSARWTDERLPRGATSLMFVALILSALAAEWIGIHAIFGAFLLGAVIPRDSALARSFINQLESVATVLLLPAFFAITGMRTRIDLISGADQWLLFGLILLVATVGKFGGAFAAARLSGWKWRDAAALGALMNARGLMELIVLNIGLELGVISTPLFALMVLMALATTLMATPALRLFLPGGTSGTARPVAE